MGRIADNPLKGFCHNAIGQFKVVCDMRGVRMVDIDDTPDDNGD
jgi:hypothetical protein